MLVPFLGNLGLQCPSYHNPASYIIEVACGEYGDHMAKLVNAINNGKNDIREEKHIGWNMANANLNNSSLVAKENNVKSVNNDIAKESATTHMNGNSNLLNNAVNDIAKNGKWFI